MCGLVGIIAKRANGFWTKEVEMFEQLLYADALRGFDATGIFGVDKEGNLDVKKQASPAAKFINTSKYEEFRKKAVSDYQFVIGHNRHATKGDKKMSKNAHPFWDKDAKICLVHNGTISNQKEFCKEAEVDSAAIANALATKGIEEVIENIEGAFALIWYNVDEKALYMIRNSQRPLTIGENNETFAIASEWSMLNWISSRNQTKYETIHVLSEDTLSRITLSDRKLENLGKIEKKKSATQQTYIGPHGRQTSMPIITEGAGVTKPIPSTTSDFDGTCPPQFFWTDADIQTPQDVMALLSRRDFVQFQIDGYIENKSKDRLNVRLECSMINITHPWLKIKVYVSKPVFDLMDLTQPYRGRILSMTIESSNIIIYASLGTELEVTETKNDIFVTEDMWMDETFPCECDVCNQPVRWDDLKDCELLLNDMSIETLICHRCTTCHTNE